MGGACVAEQMILGQPSPEWSGRRLNLVAGEQATTERRAQSLAEYVWGLAPEDTCFSCGEGRLQLGEASPGRVGTLQAEEVPGRLVCDCCGAEVRASRAA